MFKFIQVVCCICLEQMLKVEIVATLPCAHTYHRECLRRNAASQNRRIWTTPCPQCKRVPQDMVVELGQLEAELRLVAIF